MDKLKNIEVKLEEHIKLDDKRFLELGENTKEIKNDIKGIKENHLTHIQGAITNIEISVAKNTTDTDWLKRFFYIIATAVIGGLAVGVANLLKG